MGDPLYGLAVNPALPGELVGRLIAHALAADAWPASALTERDDLSRDQVLALAAHDDALAVSLARRGRLHAADIDPSVRPGGAASRGRCRQSPG
ncbi:hypothetical protein [Streptomyces sp. NPDC059564]|uniref:hypothetical protein n=1 Tax=Streptomyces sp. NPDC059564 TaxID=3346865 RepID=UPI003682CD96